MSSPAEQLFRSLDTYAEVERLIDEGEAEGPYLECKSPQAPRLGRDLQGKLAQAVSGFSNSGGGVILWGVSTTHHVHSDLDVLAQIEPIGRCRTFASRVDNHVPRATTPAVVAEPSVVLRAQSTDTKGVVVTYIPPTLGDPVRSNIHDRFYIRIASSFSPMPYEILKRMFMGTRGPELRPVFEAELIKREAGELWRIPVCIENQSSAVGEHTTVLAEFLDPEACQSIAPISAPMRFQDISGVNPGKRVFSVQPSTVIHRGLPLVVGEFAVSMSSRKLPRRALRMRITVFADHMRAKAWDITVNLAKSRVEVRQVREEYLY